MSDKKPTLRSAQWFGTADKNGFMYRSWMKNQGIADHQFQGKPIIGICNTWSELTPCNAHFRQIAEHVKRGVIEAGGFPVEFPVFSNGESNLRPTAMLTRNLASMDVEEAIRGNPIDGVVLLTGCDKTTPALLMGAASCDVPAIVVTGGPMLNGKHKGKNPRKLSDIDEADGEKIVANVFGAKKNDVALAAASKAEAKGGIDINVVVVRHVFAAELFCLCNAWDNTLLAINGCLLVRVLAIAQSVFQLER